jgi:hypothetical protein
LSGVFAHICKTIVTLLINGDVVVHASVVMEALKVDNFPKLWPLLEPIFRKVVSILASYNKLAMVVAVHT